MFKAIEIFTIKGGNFKVTAVRNNILVADVTVTPSGNIIDCTFKEGTKPYKELCRTAINTLKEHGWLPYY